MFADFQAGSMAFLLAFAAALIFLAVFKVLYQLVTPFHEGRLIREGNAAAAISLGGALLGYVLPLCSALSHTVSLLEFSTWATLSGLVQIAVFTVIRLVLLRDVSQRIERGEISAAIYLLSISLAVGLLNAACMST